MSNTMTKDERFQKTLQDDIFHSISNAVKRNLPIGDLDFLKSKNALNSKKTTYFYVCLYYGKDIVISEAIANCAFKLCSEKKEVLIPKPHGKYKMCDVFHDDYSKDNPDPRVIVVGEILYD